MEISVDPLAGLVSLEKGKPEKYHGEQGSLKHSPENTAFGILLFVNRKETGFVQGFQPNEGHPTADFDQEV
jgi:hypothetical protein